MAKDKKPKVNWTKIEESVFSIGIGLFLIVLAPLNVFIDIIGGIFIVPGAGYLLAQPQVRLNLKLFVNFVSRKQVFKDANISGSNVVSNVTAESGGTVQITQGVSREKTPYLRVDPEFRYSSIGSVQAGNHFDWLDFSVIITNIGDGIATNIQGEANFVGPEVLALPNQGKFNVHDLGPMESVTQRVVSDRPPKLAAQKSYAVVVTFKDIAGKNFPSTKIEGQLRDLKLL